MRALPAPRSAIGESPVWVADEAALYWTDIVGRRIHRHQLESGSTTSWASPEAIGCFARDRRGGFVAATERGFHQLSLEGPDAELTAIDPVLDGEPGLRMNDGRCDRQGRFWAASMAWAPAEGERPGGLFRLGGARAARVLDGLIVPNGLAWSPDGRTMYAADSHRSVALIWRFDFDPDDGAPYGRRVFLDMRDHGARPDGAAVDVLGCYWIAATDRGALLRFTPKGVLDRVIDTPVPHPTMPAFGGDDLRTLFVTSLRPAAAAPDADDGGVFRCEVEVPGMPEPMFDPDSTTGRVQSGPSST